MSYSNLILSDRPLSYWSEPQISRNNLLTDNQYSLESSTSGWTALSDTTISRVNSDSYVGDYSLSVTADALSSSGFVMSSGSRIQCSYGRFYTMVARVKGVSGSRNVSIKISYYTTQSGATLSETERTSDSFDISNTEWTTIYHTEIIPTGYSTNYFASWGIVSDGGDVGDEFLVDGIQFFEGPLYSLYDLASNNDAKLRYYSHRDSKPIVFNGEPATRLDYNSFIDIENVYKYFVKGKENSTVSLDFWFTINKKPSGRHELIKLGGFAKCYLESDKIYLEDQNGQVSFIRLNNWSDQHYVNIYYSNRRVGLYVDNNDEIVLDLGQDFEFSRSIDFFTPSISFGPGSRPYNIINNEIFNDVSLWQENNSSVSIITSDYYSGGSCLSVSKQSVSDSGISYTNYVPVEQYKEYTASVYVKIPEGGESGDIRLKIDCIDILDNNAIKSSYESIVSVSSSDGWKRISKTFMPDVYESAISITIDQPSSGSATEVFLVDALLLENSPIATTWDEYLYDSDPLFISSIAIYPFKLTEGQRLRRVNYGFIDNPNGTAIEKRADIFNTNLNSQIKLLEFSPTEIDNVENMTLNNFSQINETIRQVSAPDEGVTVGTLGASPVLDRYGIKFNGDAYINLRNTSRYFNPTATTIRFQIDLDASGSDGTILHFSPAVSVDAIALQKRSNKIVLSSITDDVESTLCESSILTSGLINVAINFDKTQISLYVNGEELSTDAIELNSPTQIIFGSVPGTEDSIDDYVRNLCFDDITAFNNINWLSNGKYMLRLNGNLKVSQKSELFYEFYPPVSSNNSVVFSNDSSNNLIYVNDNLVTESTYIPDFNHDLLETISLNVISETSDSLNKLGYVSRMNFSIYNSESIDSSRGNFVIQPDQFSGDTYTDVYENQYGGYVRNPYIAKHTNSNILSHDDNLGMKFIRDISAGCSIIPVSDSYRMMEFVFKINSIPNNNEEFCIFDIDQTYSVYFSDQGVSKAGTFELFIDGVEITDVSQLNIIPDEFYHLAIVIPISASQNISIGRDSLNLNGINGTIGNIIMYTSLMSNHSEFVASRYSDIVGVPKRIVSEDTISISDSESGTQTYLFNNSRDYYRMSLLPKVKMVLDA